MIRRRDKNIHPTLEIIKSVIYMYVVKSVFFFLILFAEDVKIMEKIIQGNFQSHYKIFEKRIQKEKTLPS